MERLRKIFPNPNREFVYLTSEDELGKTKEALADFLGEIPPLSFQILPSGKYKITKLPPHIELRRLVFNQEKNSWNDPFFDFLFSMLAPHQQEILRKQGILMIRRKEPGKKFTQAVHHHSTQYHNGALSFTELTLYEGLNGRAYNGNPEEMSSLQKIESAASHMIEFYPLTDDEDAQEAIKVINQSSNPYEFEYAIFSTTHWLSQRANRFSSIPIGAGIIGEPGLEKLTQIFGDQFSQIISQLAGDILGMAIAASDRIGDHISLLKDEGKINQYFALCAQILRYLPSEVKKIFFSQVERYQALRKQLAHRLFVLSLTATTAIILSSLSQLTDSLTPYALIPVLNTSIITAYEIYERGEAFKKIPISDENFTHLLEKIPQPLRLLFTRMPRSYALAYNDFAINNYAVGTLIGSFLATLSVFPAEMLGLRREWIYSLSGMITEPLTALFYGLANKQDPYSKFCQELNQRSHRVT